jgi:excisionase family DNA binding protein
MELLTVHEAAKLLKVNPITVRRFIAQGRLAAVRVGKTIRVRTEALDEFITPVRPEPAKPAKRAPAGRPTSADDPLWNIVGIASTAEPTDASKKHEYLADAYSPQKS